MRSIFGCGLGETTSPSPTSTSCSFSPGAGPITSIGISTPGSLPESRIMFSARSMIRTGSPMSST